MAVTRLLNIGESSPSCPYKYLSNSIYYILDEKHHEEKTLGGRLVGGNCGLHYKEVLDAMLQTKKDFGKENMRQGYHFIISFARGETDHATAYEVVRQWCEEYLGDNYDYVFAIHVDKKHMHGHIVFNSVSRIDGYKYHYKKGDWAKSIQPITDRICIEHGLDPLKFEEERVGVSYASWYEKKTGKLNWTKILRADIDYAIQRSSSVDEFVSIMKEMNYTIRLGGHSRFGGAPYIVYEFHGPDGSVIKKRRGYDHLPKDWGQKRRGGRLPEGYGPEKLAERIKNKSGSCSYEEVVEQLSGQAAEFLSMSSAAVKSTKTYKRLYQAVSYYQLPNPLAVPAYQTRRDMLRLDQLIEDCRYLKEHNVTERGILEERAASLEQHIRKLTLERKSLYAVMDTVSGEQLELMDHYHVLQQRMTEEEARGSDRFEEIEDEMKKMEEKLPYDLLETKDRLEHANRQLAALQKEKRVALRILAAEAEPGQQMKPRKTLSK